MALNVFMGSRSLEANVMISIYNSSPLRYLMLEDLEFKGSLDDITRPNSKNINTKR